MVALKDREGTVAEAIDLTIEFGLIRRNGAGSNAVVVIPRTAHMRWVSRFGQDMLRGW